ncbi:hypothetical protein MA16_Dca010854 [Dendrobium catenatum]|uniref:Uncharacterized protein n=1 Tax=Dendrobium catenatum TaxID=906689 RepID=A0A2I0XFG0_9ASPA|nr:hypothetical protein MA16_Dca010854 [Dendrobium catenatum]
MGFAVPSKGLILAIARDTPDRGGSLCMLRFSVSSSLPFTKSKPRISCTEFFWFTVEMRNEIQSLKLAGKTNNAVTATTSKLIIILIQEDSISSFNFLWARQLFLAVLSEGLSPIGRKRQQPQTEAAAGRTEKTAAQLALMKWSKFLAFSFPLLCLFGFLPGVVFLWLVLPYWVLVSVLELPLWFSPGAVSCELFLFPLLGVDFDPISLSAVSSLSFPFLFSMSLRFSSWCYFPVAGSPLLCAGSGPCVAPLVLPWCYFPLLAFHITFLISLWTGPAGPHGTGRVVKQATGFAWAEAERTHDPREPFLEDFSQFSAVFPLFLLFFCSGQQYFVEICCKGRTRKQPQTEAITGRTEKTTTQLAVEETSKQKERALNVKENLRSQGERMADGLVRPATSMVGRGVLEVDLRPWGGRRGNRFCGSGRVYGRIGRWKVGDFGLRSREEEKMI